jgi:hypothetical protein
MLVTIAGIILLLSACAATKAAPAGRLSAANQLTGLNAS